MSILTRERVRSLLCAAVVSLLAPGFVFGIGEHSPIGIGDDTGASQMVAEDEGQRAVLPHSNALISSIVILGDNSIRDIVIVVDEVGGG